MKLTVVAVGKLRDRWVQSGCEEYLQRMRGKVPVSVEEVKAAGDVLGKIKERHRLWALDARGTQLSSEELAQKLGAAMNHGEAGIVLAIGGADGLPEDLVKRADFRWSLGRLTLPHRLARLVVIEQLYRALSILRGEPYHRA